MRRNGKDTYAISAGRSSVAIPPVSSGSLGVVVSATLGVVVSAPLGVVGSAPLEWSTTIVSTNAEQSVVITFALLSA